MQSTRLVCRGLALVLAVASAGVGVAQEGATAPAHSETLPLATTQALILDVTDAASRAVAVGERGQILVSESRAEWRQIDNVPTRATLTAVTAVGDAVWAVGHDGTILASRDGGLTWTLQRVDVLDTFPDAPFDPRQGMPLLDVLMLDAQHGFAVGAYAQLLRTDDAGAHWTFVPTQGGDGAQSDGDAADIADEDDIDAGTEEDSWSLSDDDLALDEEPNPHFNAIARTGSGALFIVGERGAAFRSRDGGMTWERLQLPYGGSMFGLIGYEGDHLLAFGMRGNVYESSDLGDTWDALDSGTDLSLMGGAAWGNGGFALVGANGIVITRAGGTGGAQTQVYANADQETPVLSGVIARPNGSLVLTGEKGVDTFTPRKQ